MSETFGERVRTIAAIWDADPARLMAGAVDGMAWALIDETMDTSDREAPAELYQEAAQAARVALAAPPPAALDRTGASE